MEETTETIPQHGPPLHRIGKEIPFGLFLQLKSIQRDDGMVSICVGDCCGLVSSYHLVEPKELQLIAAYRKHHGS